MLSRQLAGREYQAIKAATRRLVSAAGGPSAASDVTRGAHQHMSAYGSAHPDQADRFMPVDVVADLEAQVEQPILTAALARLGGFLLVPQPRADRLGAALAIAAAKALKETSEVFVSVAERSADGEICADDAAAISKEIDEAMIKLAALKLQVQAEGGQ